MKLKIIFSVLVLFAAISCGNVDGDPKPIEKYQNKGYVTIHIIKYSNFNYFELKLKSPDTIFWVKVEDFDAQDIQIGDTLKSK